MAHVVYAIEVQLRLDQNEHKPLAINVRRSNCWLYSRRLPAGSAPSLDRWAC
jgi:hypothetical protein